MEQEQLTGLEPTWAVIELFGHQQIAGQLSTVTLGGSVLLKVEVPERISKGIHVDYGKDYNDPARNQQYEIRTPAYQRLFGVGAIYAINPCTEELARKMMQNISPSAVAQAQSTKTMLALPPAEAVVPSEDAEAQDPADESEDGLPGDGLDDDGRDDTNENPIPF